MDEIFRQIDAALAAVVQSVHPQQAAALQARLADERNLEHLELQAQQGSIRVKTRRVKGARRLLRFGRELLAERFGVDRQEQLSVSDLMSLELAGIVLQALEVDENDVSPAKLTERQAKIVTDPTLWDLAACVLGAGGLGPQQRQEFVLEALALRPEREAASRQVRLGVASGIITAAPWRLGLIEMAVDIDAAGAVPRLRVELVKSTRHSGLIRESHEINGHDFPNLKLSEEVREAINAAWASCCLAARAWEAENRWSSRPATTSTATSTAISTAAKGAS